MSDDAKVDTNVLRRCDFIALLHCGVWWGLLEGQFYFVHLSVNNLSPSRISAVASAKCAL